MRKIAFVDWDDTISSIKKIKEAYFVYLSTWFPLDIIKKTYEESKIGGYFDANKHCVLLDDFMGLISGASRVSGDTRVWLEDWFEAEEKLFREFIFPDAELFLRTLVHNVYEVHILTLGTEWFQEEKIENSGLMSFISGITVTQDPTKIAAIGDLCDPITDDIVLFDDSWRVIDAVKQTFPKVFAVQVLRKDEDVSKKAARADAFARNLGEAIGAVLSRSR